MEKSYPYATPEKDGYHLDLVEFDKWESHSHLRHPVPLDEHRYTIKPLELVKLIFRYRDPHVVGDTTYLAEHMWVQYYGNSDGCMMGRLDNDPQHTTLLKADDPIMFHPKHIVQIWGYDPDGPVIRGTTPIPPKEDSP
jgi:Uncharacterized protein conserved in bacteria (DUF2314)